MKAICLGAKKIYNFDDKEGNHREGATLEIISPFFAADGQTACGCPVVEVSIKSVFPLKELCRNSGNNFPCEVEIDIIPRQLKDGWAFSCSSVQYSASLLESFLLN